MDGRGAIRVLSTNSFHLGVAGKAEWDIFEDQKVDGEKLALNFEGEE